jgi:subtilisin family serine protease
LLTAAKAALTFRAERAPSSTAPPVFTDDEMLMMKGRFFAERGACAVAVLTGDQITSTYPMDRGGFSGYARMSGTSMACPHVSGIVALCYASGVCSSNTTTEFPAIVGPCVEHVEATANYRYMNDPLTGPLPDKYYGYLAWARKWWVS